MASGTQGYGHRTGNRHKGRINPPDVKPNKQNSPIVNKKIIFLILSTAGYVATVFGQEPQPLSISLETAIDRARTNSVEAEMAVNELRTAYWGYRTYRAELLPELSFAATVPAYYRQFSAYMNSDGSYSFVPNNYLQLNGQLSVTQNVWLTGGQISLRSNLDFYRQFGDPTFNRFMSIPVSVTFTQPIFGCNNIKWDRKIEPVRYEEAKAAYISAMEEVAAKAIQYYFSLLMARENRDIALQNTRNSERLYEVAREKRVMGKISENDLLQMELNLLNARTKLTQSESDLKSNMFQLRTFLDLGDDTELEPVIPLDIPEVEIGYGDALEKALANNSFAKTMLRMQLEADYEVAKAKGAQREISLFLQLGYTGTGNDLTDSYGRLKGNQIAQLGVDIPLVDWGRRKGNVKVAESNRRLIESRINKEQADFRQNLFILVEKYGNQLRLLQTARRADEIARKRYATNMETFIIGKISTLDLNDSQVKKDEARREYVNELYLFWLYYYRIRSVTLWDYRHNAPLTLPEGII